MIKELYAHYANLSCIRPFVYFGAGPSYYDKYDIEGGVLSEYAGLKVLNNFPGIKLDKLQDSSKCFTNYYNKPKGYAARLDCPIRIVGEEYPIAFYVDCKLDLMNSDKCLTMEEGIIGFAPQNKLEEGLKDALTTIIERFAIQVLKVKGDL